MIVKVLLDWFMKPHVLRLVPVSFARVWRVEEMLLMFDMSSKDFLESLANLVLFGELFDFQESNGASN